MIATIDPSTRFILPADAPWLRNLPLLWANHAKLAAQVETCEARASHQVEISKSGMPTLAIDDGARTAYLHSRHHPLDEAARSVDALAINEQLVFFIHGLGLGYQAELLFDRAGEEAAYFIFEPDLDVIRRAMEHRDLSRLLNSRRVNFIWQADKNLLHEKLAPYGATMSLGTIALTHQASVQRDPAFHQQVTQWCDEFASYAKTSLNTLVINGRRTAENIARNIGWYAASSGLGHLKDARKGQPAIIVSAGPSLRKNKHLLKDAQDRAVMIAVQTTLKPLLELGVEPDFVTSLDYHDICTRFFEDLPGNLRTHLIAEPKATDRIFSMHTGPVSLNGNEFAEGLLRELKPNRARLPAGATVAHLAFYLAEHLGCDPVIFVGQDLGFSDGLCYAPGTSYDDVWRPEFSRYCSPEMKQWEQIARDRPILRKIPDHLGRPMYTEERLFTYLQQFERDFAATKRIVIDASEGGAMKRGAQVMTLAEALSRHCATRLEDRSIDTRPLEWSRLHACLESLVLRKQEAERIGEIAQRTGALLATLSDALDKAARVNQLIAEIDRERALMNTLGATYDLILQMSQAVELKRFQADVKLAASKALGIDRQRRQIARDIANVEGVQASAGAFAELMDEVIDRLRGQVEAQMVAA